MADVVVDAAKVRVGCADGVDLTLSRRAAFMCKTLQNLIMDAMDDSTDADVRLNTTGTQKN
jgi:hypothetical protein